MSIDDLRLPISDSLSRNSGVQPGSVSVADCGKRPGLMKSGKIPIGNRKSEIGNLTCSRRGMTLIEVMLAVVILGIGTGVLLLATAKCLAIVTKSQRYSAAQRLLLRVDAEHPLTRGTIETGIESGRFDDEEDYRWEREIIQSENELLKNRYTVRTRVIWSDRGRNSFDESIIWRYIKPEEEE